MVAASPRSARSGKSLIVPPPSTVRLPKMREDLFAQETHRTQDLRLLHAWPLDSDDQRGYPEALTIARDLLADARRIAEEEAIAGECLKVRGEALAGRECLVLLP